MKDKRKPKAEVVGKVPANARITIDYTKIEDGKPSVKFDYPRKDFEKQLAFNSYSMFIALFLTIIPATIFFMFMQEDMLKTGLLPNLCTIDLETTNKFNISVSSSLTIPGQNIISSQVNKSTYSQDLVLTCDNKTKYYEINKRRRILFFDEAYMLNSDAYRDNNLSLENSSFLNNLGKVLIIVGRGYKTSPEQFGIAIFLVSFIAFVFVTPLISKIILKQKWFIKSYPKFGRGTAKRGYYASFKSVPENNVLEIPVFKNIWMDYKASGDYSKYLAKVEIREHPFSKIVRRYKGRGKSMKLKMKRNIAYWYAKYYFSQNPKSGKLEVWFR